MTPPQAMDLPPAWLHLMAEVAREEAALEAITHLDSTVDAFSAVMSKDGARGYKKRRELLVKQAGL